MKSLSTIEIRGFKSIRDLNLNLHSLNILIGSNGVGKSNFITVFKFLNQILNQNLQLYVAQRGGADQILHYGRQQTESLQIKLVFGGNEYMCSLIPTTNDSLIFAREFLSYQTTYDNRSRELGSGHSESRLLEDKRQHRRGMGEYTVDAIGSWQVYHFHDTSDSAKIKATNDLDDNRYLRSDASNLAAFLYYLREKEPVYYQNIVDTIRQAAPFFDDFDLRPSPFNPNKIKLEWRERGSNAYFDASLLSDGSLRFMSLVTLLMQPPEHLPATILLDEPELGLHPYAITILADLLHIAAIRVQVIVATQSVTLVNHFTPEEIIVVERENGQSVFNRLEESEIVGWLEDYNLGELWEKNVLGGRPAMR